MKKVISVIGIICLMIVILVNILYTATLDSSEHITISNNVFIYVLAIISVGILIYAITNFVNKKILNSISEKRKKIILYILIGTYTVLNIIWIVFVRPPIIGDQIHACNLAQTFYNNNLEEFLPNMTYAGIPLRMYMQKYHQQISLAFVFSLFFKLIHFDGIGVLRVLNVIGNVAIVIALYKITQQLSKKFEANKTRVLFLIITFTPLLMLTTFIYGDIPSIALCLFATYFMMKYSETKKIKYPIGASIFTMFAYMMRMNSLIFIIATEIYLILNLLNENNKSAKSQDLNIDIENEKKLPSPKLIHTNFKNSQVLKKIFVNTAIICMYALISILPANAIQNYYLKKYNMDRNDSYPVISYLLMAMEESWRGCGWYSENRGEYALKNTDKAKVEYKDEIKKRLEYFSNNKKYAFEFYTKKLTSMWSENTYSAVGSNITKENDPIEKCTKPLAFYEKSILVLMCVCVIIFLIEHKKDISLDVIFLITIFIGGFLFHIIWEAKSRYIIPYIIVIMPVASLCINGIKFKFLHFHFQ